MPTPVAELIALGVTAYLAIGVPFALCFAWFGVQRVDPAAASVGLGFRLIILPGCALLWPLMLWRWLRKAPPPTERNAHRATTRHPEQSGPGTTDQQEASA